MASSFFAAFDYRSQIIENCEFISSKDDSLSIIVLKEASGEWKAIIVREDDDNRDAFLSSEPCNSFPKAIESLYIKSAEAAAIYIKTNGFDFLRRPQNEEDLSSDDDTASVISGKSEKSRYAASVWESSDEEPATPASSCRGEKSSTKATKKTRKRSRARNTQANESESSEDERGEKAPNGRPGPGSVRQPPARFPQGPPPPPMYRGQGPVPIYQPPSRPVTGMAPPLPISMPLPMLHRGMPPPPASGGVGPMDPAMVAQQCLHDVRITVTWLHHGEQRIFESTRASLRALQELTLSYVRSHFDAFDNVTPMERASINQKNNQDWVLRASVKQAFFGTEAYDMSGYRGDDLTKLFNVMGQTDIPRFEIEVHYVRPVGMSPMAGPIPPGGPGITA